MTLLVYAQGSYHFLIPFFTDITGKTCILIPSTNKTGNDTLQFELHIQGDQNKTRKL